MPETTIGKIIVVDDEVELRNALVEALASQSFEVRGFTNGPDALAALREEDFDLMLSDLMMPGMDGISLVKFALEIDPHLIALIMTGQGTIQTAVDAMKVGAFDYVLKPFRLQSVMPILTRALNTRRLRLENLQLRETVAIFELSQTIAFTLDPQTIISKLADAALQQTDADEVSILLPTEDGQELYVAAVRGENRQRLLGERVPLEESISGWVARQRQPLILAGEINDERFRSMCPHPEIRSAISIPMQVANKLIGTININALNRARPFTLGQMKALTILASTAAAALESASLYTQVQKAEENYRSIFENAVEGMFQSTPQGRFITVNPAMARIFGYDSPKEMIEGVTDITHQIYVDPEDRVKSAELTTKQEVLHGFEFQAYRKDGKRIWLSLNRRSVCDENGIEVYREGSVEDISERKRVQEALKASEGELRALFAAITDVIIVFDADGRYLKIAPTNSAYSHKPPDDLIGKTQHDVFPKDTADLLVSEIRRSLKERCAHRVEYSLQLDGTEVWFDGSVAPLSEDSVIWIARDITERKRAEAALHFQKTLLESQSEASIDGILVTSDDRKILSFNQRFVDLWGVSETALGSRSDEAALQSVLDKLGDPREFLDGVEYLYKHPQEDSRDEIQLNDGRTLDRYTAPIKSSQDEYFGRVWFFRDITERKRAEENLRASEERYRDLVENAHDIIYSHDLEGNYTSMNKAGETITGYTVEEALKLNLARTVAPEYLTEVREMLQRKLAGDRVTAYEMEIIAKDGRRVTVEANTKLVYQDGVAIGVQGIARDITERKQLEDQLRQSQKMEAIGQLAGGVAHDFNNLLTAINGYSSLALQRMNGNDPIRGYLEEIKKAGDRAANLTRQLLAFGRKQILQPLALNLNGVVKDMNNMLRRLIGEDIVLAAKLDPALKKIKADPGQIEQVLVNLVVNARDAMPQGGNLTIETANVELREEYTSKHVGVRPGNYAMLAISDTGVGMNEETQARIFDPFFTTKEKDKGTGLGLSTVYGIVKQSGGNIWVYSEPGHGTTFKIYLPQIESPAAQTEIETKEEDAPRGSETILLVEDEDVVRGLARQILEQAGYHVLEARGGEEAVHLSTEHSGAIDLLLTDVVMPKASGKEIANLITSIRPDLRVLFMSGYTDEAIVHHGVLDSGVEFIQKPFTPASLARKVREVLETEEAQSD